MFCIPALRAVRGRAEPAQDAAELAGAREQHDPGREPGGGVRRGRGARHRRRHRTAVPESVTFTGKQVQKIC